MMMDSLWCCLAASSSCIHTCCLDESSFSNCPSLFLEFFLFFLVAVLALHACLSARIRFDSSKRSTSFCTWSLQAVSAYTECAESSQLMRADACSRGVPVSMCMRHSLYRTCRAPRRPQPTRLTASVLPVLLALLKRARARHRGSRRDFR